MRGVDSRCLYLYFDIDDLLFYCWPICLDVLFTPIQSNPQYGAIPSSVTQSIFRLCYPSNPRVAFPHDTAEINVPESCPAIHPRIRYDGDGHRNNNATATAVTAVDSPIST